jgi:hypothetical protein
MRLLILQDTRPALQQVDKVRWSTVLENLFYRW